MKRYGKGFLMAFGMFSTIPVPRSSWDDGAMPLILSFFPWVGAVVGGVWYGAFLLARKLSLPPVVEAAFLVIVPLLLTGFLHLDGFMDTADAILSRRDLLEKRRILKDPHTGAFGVLSAILLFLLQFAGVYSVNSSQVPLLPVLLIPILSRCIAGLALMILAPISDTGYGASFRKNTGFSHKFAVSLTAVLCFSAAILTGGLTGLITLLALLVGSAVALFYVFRQLRGISGDLCGCVLVVGELCGILTLTILGGY